MADGQITRYLGTARRAIVRRLRRVRYYPALYPSAWRGRWAGTPRSPAGAATAYFTAVPHPGAGIGHQIANWIAGYWFARQFGLRYAHSAFPSAKWETLLGFGRGEISVETLRAQGHRSIRLPMFDEDNVTEVDRIRRIIRAYDGRRVVFVAEQDQFYREQYGVMADIREKFAQAFATNAPSLCFEASVLNIAVHVRRGDIGTTEKSRNPNLALRWQDTDYFLKVTKNVLKVLPEKYPCRIWLFSQGELEDFSSFMEIPNVVPCLDMGARESFLHMARANILITSKSSFSYKPALLGDGIKICPSEFWHGYPEDSDWIVANSDGSFPLPKLVERLSERWGVTKLSDSSDCYGC